jgi:hypothetical protein
VSIRKSLVAGVALAAGLSFGPARAGIDLNEVGAFLVYPGVAAVDNGAVVETFLTITNTSSQSILAHVSFINGDEYSSRYCYECDFDVPMSGLDTETLVLTRDGNNTHILNLDTGASRTCAQSVGFVTVDVEDANHVVLTDNILLGEEVVVTTQRGRLPVGPPIRAIPERRPISSSTGPNTEVPSVIGADFLAPTPWRPTPTWSFHAGLRPSVPAADRLLRHRLRRVRGAVLEFVPVRLLDRQDPRLHRS